MQADMYSCGGILLNCLGMRYVADRSCRENQTFYVQ